MTGREMKYWNHDSEVRALILEGDHDGSGRITSKEYRVLPGRSVKINLQDNPHFAKAIFISAPWLKPISVTEILFPAVARPDGLYEEPKTRLAIEHHIAFIERELAIANGEYKWMIVYKNDTGKEAPQYVEAMARLQYLKTRLAELQAWKAKKEREESIAYISPQREEPEMPQIKVERVGQPAPQESAPPPAPARAPVLEHVPEKKAEVARESTSPAASEGEESDEDANSVSGSQPIALPPSGPEADETPMPTPSVEDRPYPMPPVFPSRKRGRPKRK